MTLELPPPLVWMANVVFGPGAWPQADEDKGFEAADSWDQLAVDYAQVAHAVQQAKVAVRQQFEMQAADRFDEWVDGFTAGDQNYIQAASDMATSIGKLNRDTAANVQYAKYMVFVQLAQLYIQWQWAFILSLFGIEGPLIEWGFQSLFGKAIIGRILSWITENIVQHVVINEVMMVPMDLLIQGVQKLNHERDGVDWNLTAQSAEFGLMMGGLTRPAGELGHLLTAGLEKAAANAAKTGGKDLASVLKKDLDNKIDQAGLGLKDTFNADLTHLAEQNAAGLKAIGKGTGSLLGPAVKLGADFGGFFEKHFGETLGADAARSRGIGFGAQLAGNWRAFSHNAGASLPNGAIRTTLTKGLQAETGDLTAGVRDALAHHFPEAVFRALAQQEDHDLALQVGKGVIGAAVSGTHGALAQGLATAAFDPSHRFTFSFGVFASMAIMHPLGHVLPSAESGAAAGKAARAFVIALPGHVKHVFAAAPWASEPAVRDLSTPSGSAGGPLRSRGGGGGPTRPVTSRPSTMSHKASPDTGDHASAGGRKSRPATQSSPTTGPDVRMAREVLGKQSVERYEELRQAAAGLLHLDPAEIADHQDAVDSVAYELHHGRSDAAAALAERLSPRSAEQRADPNSTSVRPHDSEDTGEKVTHLGGESTSRKHGGLSSENGQGSKSGGKDHSSDASQDEHDTPPHLKVDFEPTTDLVKEMFDELSTLPELLPVDEVLAGTRIGLLDGRTVAVWLPGSPEEAPPFDAETIALLDDLVPPGSVFVFGTMRNGRPMAGGRQISETALAGAIAGKAPGLQPILVMSGSESIAGSLARRLGTPVVSTPYDVAVDLAKGKVLSTGPSTGAKSPSSEVWFRLHEPGDTAGRPLVAEFTAPSPEHGAASKQPPPHMLEPGSGQPKTVDPMVRSIGVPKAGLPYLPQLIRELRQLVRDAGESVPEEVWDTLPQRLLSNYPYLLGEHGSGLLVPLGKVEALITLDPTEPHSVGNPAASFNGPSTAPPLTKDGKFHANETVNAAYATGAHVQTQSGPTGATRGALSLSFGVGLTPSVLNVLKVGAAISGTANQSNRSTNRVVDTEGGHVEDNRVDSTLLSYTPNWSMKIRTDPSVQWNQVDAHELADPGTEKLLLWVPEHYLGTAPDQVTATGDAVMSTRLPDTFYASGLTNLPELFDEIVTVLQRKGLELPIGGVTRDELLQKLWNLNAHLDEAVNGPRGYHFWLHDKHGRPVASVNVRTTRMPDGTLRVGETSDKAHLENVRTAIDGTGGSHSLTNSSSLTPLNAELDLLPIPAIDDLGLGLSGYASFTWSNTDGVSAGRTGLNVLVPRYTGHTAAYRMQFEHTATVSVRGSKEDEPRTTPPVRGQGLVRMPEPKAFEHGFPVDKQALKTDPGDVTEVPYDPEALRNTGRQDGDPETKPVPAHVDRGKGIGMGLVTMPETTPERILAALKPQLRAKGFLPTDEDDPFRGRSWWEHGNDLDSRLDNLDLLEKMISRRGLESHYDQIHQDGMTFTLRHRRGFAGADLDVDSAKITVKAVGNPDRPPEFRRSTDEYHTVNLLMGMDSAGQFSGGSRKFAFGFRFKALYAWFKSGGLGAERQWTVGATDSVNFLNNRPELLEYPGVVDEFALTSDYEITIKYQHSGLQGKVDPEVRDPQPIRVTGQTALAHLLRLGDGSQDGPTSTEPTPREVLDQAVIYYLDTSGTKRAATEAFKDLVGPAGSADQELSTFASTIEMRSHLKEIVNGEYTTDQPFKSGFFRDTHGALNISGELGASTFSGSTSDKFVLGIIKLWLAQSNITDTSSKGITWDQLDAAFGGTEGPVNLSGEFDINRHWQHNTSATDGRTGGTELIQLEFSHVYAYTTTVDFTVTGRQEKHAKLLPNGSSHHEEPVPARRMMYLLSEPEALTRYAEGTLPVSDDQLADALTRWQKGDLTLSGSVVAKILTRWTTEVRRLPATVKADRAVLAEVLSKMHAAGALPVMDSDAREAFTRTFGHTLPDPADRFREMEMPEYLTRDDRGGRILGHRGVYDLTYDNEKSTYQIVKELVDKVAPGLLTAGAEVWDSEGRVIGRLQGGVDSLQAMFARGRDQAMWDDILSANGQSFYLVNPKGWLLSDVVEINLADVLTSAPEVHDVKPDTGLENYGHGYTSNSKGKSRDGSQAFTAPKFGAGGGHESGGADLHAAEGHHRGTTRSETGTTEQTVYDWSGHYRLGFRHELTVGVRRLKMSGRPLNNALMESFGRWTGHEASDTVTVPGSLEIEVPRGIAESSALQGPDGPRSFVPLPKLPGDAYVAGTMLDDALSVGRTLLEKMFGHKAGGVTTRSSLSLPVLLSRSHLTNHLLEASGGNRYKLAENLFIPGHSSDRASMWLTGDLYDLKVIVPIKDGTGTGRYTKHQRGTTPSSSTDPWRATTDASLDGFGNLKAHDPPHTADGGTNAIRTTSVDQASAGTENYRREQHVKQQGPVYLVRLRGRYRLEAEKFHRNLFGAPTTSRGRYRSDPITGDVYAEMFEDEVEALRAQLAEATEKNDATAWSAQGEEATFGLGPLLADAADKNLGASRAYQEVARHIRKAVGGDEPVVLTVDQAALTNDTYRSVRHWAAHTMGIDLAAAGLPDTRNPTPEDITAIVNEVNRVHAPNPTDAPVPLPPDVPVFGLDPAHVARDVAHELNAHVRLETTRPDGTVTRHWIDPAGRMYAFDPATFDDTVLSADMAQEAGLLPPWLRPDVDAFDVDAFDLGRIYRTSWARQQTFEQALSAEIDQRRARLETLNTALPPLLTKAWTADGRWHDEVRRLEHEHAGAVREAARTRQRIDQQRKSLFDLHGERFRIGLDHEPGSAELTEIADRIQRAETEGDRLERDLTELSDRERDLTRDLAEAREHEREAARILDDLRAAARDDDTAHPEWDEQAVRSLADRLDALETARASADAPVNPHLPGAPPRHESADVLDPVRPDGAENALVRLNTLGARLRVRNLDNLARLRDVIGHLPENIPRLAAKLGMYDAKDLYRVARDLSADPADLIAVLPDRMARLAGRHLLTGYFRGRFVRDLLWFTYTHLGARTAEERAWVFHMARRYDIPWRDVEHFARYARENGHSWRSMRTLGHRRLRGLVNDWRTGHERPRTGDVPSPTAAPRNAVVTGEVHTDLTGFRRIRLEDDRPLPFVEHEDVPWDPGTDPFFVTLGEAGPDGGGPPLTAGDVASALADDPVVRGLAPDVPLVLLGKGLGRGSLELPREVAERLGRTVWVNTAEARLARQDGGGTVLEVVAEKVGTDENGDLLEHRGYWIRAEPPESGGYAPRDATSHEADDEVIEDVEGNRFSIGEILSWTVTDKNGRPVGRSFLGPRDHAETEGVIGGFDTRISTVDHRYEDESPVPDVPPDERRLPLDPDHTVYSVIAHGSDGNVDVWTSGGRRTIPVPSLGRVLRRQRSVQALKEGDQMFLAVCHAGTETEDRPSVIQGVSEAVGLTSTGPTGRFGIRQNGRRHVGFVVYVDNETGRRTHVVSTASSEAPTGVPPEQRSNSSAHVEEVSEDDTHVFVLVGEETSTGLAGGEQDPRSFGFEPADLAWFDGLVDPPERDLRRFADFLSDIGESPESVRAMAESEARDLVVQWRLGLTPMEHAELVWTLSTPPHEILSLVGRLGVHDHARDVALLAKALHRVPHDVDVVAEQLGVRPADLLAVAARLRADPAGLAPFAKAIAALGQENPSVTVDVVASSASAWLHENGLEPGDLGWFRGLLVEREDIRDFAQHHLVEDFRNRDVEEVRALVRSWAAHRLGISLDEYADLVVRPWWSTRDAVALWRGLGGGLRFGGFIEWLLKIDRLPEDLPDLARTWQVDTAYLTALAVELRADPRHLAPFAAAFGRYPDPVDLAATLETRLRRLGIFPSELGAFTEQMEEIGVRPTEWWEFCHYAESTHVGRPGDSVAEIFQTLAANWRASAATPWRFGLSDDEYEAYAAQSWFDHDALLELGRELWIPDMAELVRFSARIGQVPSGLVELAWHLGVEDPYDLLELARALDVRPADLALFTSPDRLRALAESLGGIDALARAGDTRFLPAGSMTQMKEWIEQGLDELGLESRHLAWFSGLVAGFDRWSMASFRAFVASRGSSLHALEEGTVEEARQLVAEWQSALTPERLAELTGGRSYPLTTVVEAGRRLGVVRMGVFVEYVLTQGMSPEHLRAFADVLPAVASEFGLGADVNGFVELISYLGVEPDHLRPLRQEIRTYFPDRADRVYEWLGEAGLRPEDLAWFSGLASWTEAKSFLAASGHSVEDLRAMPVEDVRRMVARRQLGMTDGGDRFDVVEVAAAAHRWELTRTQSAALTAMVGDSGGRIPAELPELADRWAVPVGTVIDIVHQSRLSVRQLAVFADDLGWVARSQRRDVGQAVAYFVLSRLDLLGFERPDLTWLTAVDGGLRLGDLADFRAFVEDHGQSIAALRQSPLDKGRAWVERWRESISTTTGADPLTSLRERIVAEITARHDVGRRRVRQEYVDHLLDGDLTRLSKRLGRVPYEIPDLAQQHSLSPVTLLRAAAETGIDPFHLVMLFRADLRTVERPYFGFSLDRWADLLTRRLRFVGLGGDVSLEEFSDRAAKLGLGSDSTEYQTLGTFLRRRGSSVLDLLRMDVRAQAEQIASFRPRTETTTYPVQVRQPADVLLDEPPAYEDIDGPPEFASLEEGPPSYVDTVVRDWEVDPANVTALARGLGVPPESLGSLRPMLAAMGDHPDPGVIASRVRLLRDAAAVVGVLSDHDRAWLLETAAHLSVIGDHATPLDGFAQALELCRYTFQNGEYTMARLREMTIDQVLETMDGLQALEMYEPPPPIQDLAQFENHLTTLISDALGADEEQLDVVRERGTTVEDLAGLADRAGTTDLSAVFGLAIEVGESPEWLIEMAGDVGVHASYLLSVANELGLSPESLHVLGDDLRRLHGTLSPDDFIEDLEFRLSAMGVADASVPAFLELAASSAFHSGEFRDLLDYVRRRHQGADLGWLLGLPEAGRAEIVTSWRAARAAASGARPEPVGLDQVIAEALNPHAYGGP